MVLAASVLLLPLIVAAVISARQTKRERQAEVREAAISVAVTAAASLDEAVRGFDALASGLVRHPAVANFDPAGCPALFASVLREHPLLTNIALVDAGGRVLGSGRPPSDQSIDRPWLREVLRTGKPVVSDFQVGSVSGKPVVALAYPLVSANAATGALALWLDLTSLQNTFGKIPLPKGSVVTVFDRQDRVMLRSVEPERFVGKTAARSGAAGPGDTAHADIDGVERFSGEAPAQRVPWVVSVGIPMAIVPMRLSPLWQRNIAIVVAALLGSLTLMLWISRSTSADLNHLRKAVTRIALGDLSPPQTIRTSSREVGDLQNAFVAMADNLQKAKGDLDLQFEQERRMNERLQTLQQQVVRQERLAAVGLLAGGLAHELNNPLQAILGGTELLQRGSSDAGTLAELESIKLQGYRAREIVRSLARFSSQQLAPPSSVRLAEVVADVVQVRARANAPDAPDIVVHADTNRLVHANAAELAQVVLNFLGNAHDAIRADGASRGHIVIRVKDVGPLVRLEVDDDGPGVAPENEAKLFQPFFTTKSPGKGTGLGLSVSYGIVHSYGGSIGYTRNARGGATFYFELPAVDAPRDVDDDRQAVLQRPV